MNIFYWNSRDIVNFLDNYYSQSDTEKVTKKHLIEMLMKNELPHNDGNIPQTRTQKAIKWLRHRFFPNLGLNEKSLEDQVDIAIGDNYLEKNRGAIEITPKGKKLIKFRYAIRESFKSGLLRTIFALSPWVNIIFKSIF